jgi:hypothetical protein
MTTPCKLPTKNGEIEIIGIKGLIELYQILNRYIDVSDFAKFEYRSTRISENQIDIDLNLEINLQGSIKILQQTKP